jgi:hypothetical protein
MATSGDDHRTGRNRHGDDHRDIDGDEHRDRHGDDHGDTGRWVTLGEAARVLQVTRSAIYGRIGRGTLQMRRNGNRGALVFLPSSMTAAEHHGDDHPDSHRDRHHDHHRDVDRNITVTALQAKNAELREALAKAVAEREAARAMALADVAAAKRVAEAEIAAQVAASLTKEAVLRELVNELKAQLADARKPWWQRLLGR